jgi:hypothetical protein
MLIRHLKQHDPPPKHAEPLVKNGLSHKHGLKSVNVWVPSIALVIVTVSGIDVHKAQGPPLEQQQPISWLV